LFGSAKFTVEKVVLEEVKRNGGDILWQKVVIPTQRIATLCVGIAILCVGIAILCVGIAILCVGITILCVGIAILCVRIAILCVGIAILCVGITILGVGIAILGVGIAILCFFDLNGVKLLWSLIGYSVKSHFEATCHRGIAPIVAAARCFVSAMGMQRLQRIAGRRWDENCMWAPKKQ